MKWMESFGGRNYSTISLYLCVDIILHLCQQNNVGPIEKESSKQQLQITTMSSNITFTSNAMKYCYYLKWKHIIY